MPPFPALYVTQKGVGPSHICFYGSLPRPWLSSNIGLWRKRATITV